ncbi:MAG: glycosyltransferase family 39 protein [Candidatus Woesebacteria bacterium]|nr:glycosyltransferase family 39 protein [Candidatus Woesebacteria bacterium]
MILKFVKKNYLFLIILIAGMFFRVYKPISWMPYGHDQDLAGWIIKDIVFDKHIRLIGQETTSKGIFIGPLFYYLQIPFFFLTKWRPTGAVFLVTLISAFGIFSYYYCFKKMFNNRVGIFVSLIYAISYLIVFTDRETVPTMPVMIWSVWFLFFLWQLYKGKQKSYLFLGLLLGLVWHFNLASIILVPLILLAQIFSRTKMNFKYILLAIGIFGILMSPFFIFEVRHGYQQTKAIALSLTAPKDYIPGTGKGFAKLDRVMQLVDKNITGLFWGNRSFYPPSWNFYLLSFVFVFLFFKTKVLDRRFGLILLFWQILYISFFSLNSLNVSEYYLNGMNVVWILLFSVFISYLFEKKKLKWFGKFLLFLLIISNLWSFIEYKSNRTNYLERRTLVKEIKNDAKRNNFPCVSVSYITASGYELGYRYLFWLEGMHVNNPDSLSPVYTIVFPHSKVDRIDKSFGALGLIYPDYKKYQPKSVEKSCSGANSNITNPMFGFNN